MSIIVNILGAGGLPVQGYVVAYGLNNVVLFGPTDTDEDGTVEIDVAAGEVLGVGAAGYDEEQIIITPEMYGQSLVVELKKRGNKLLILALVGVVGFSVWEYRKKNKISGELKRSDVLNVFLIVGGFIAFGILKKILEGLGVWKDADTKILDAAENSPNSFWSPNFWRQSQNYSYALTVDEARAYAKTIYDSFGLFNDCEECVVAVFRKMRTKANVSFVADVFAQMYGQDLLKFLRGGWWPQDRLSDADVAAINRMIAALPDF